MIRANMPVTKPPDAYKSSPSLLALLPKIMAVRANTRDRNGTEVNKNSAPIPAKEDTCPERVPILTSPPLFFSS